MNINAYVKLLEMSEDERLEYFTGVKLSWWQKLYIKSLNKWWTFLAKCQSTFKSK